MIYVAKRVDTPYTPREWNFALFFRRTSPKSPLPSLNGTMASTTPRGFSSSLRLSLVFLTFAFSPFISRFQGERLGDDEQPLPDPGDMPVVRLL